MASGAGAGPGQTAQRLLEEVQFAAAVESARTGRYDESARLLNSLPIGVAVLDLRARIHAQRGQYDEARRLWQAVREREPAHQGASRGLRWLDGGRRLAWLAGRGGLVWSGVGVLALVLVCLLGGYRLGRESDRATQAVETDNLRQELEAARVRAARAERAVRAVPIPAAIPPARKKPNRVLASVAGMHWQTDESANVAIFDQPLFRRGTHLQPDAADVLTELGKALAPLAAETSIEIVGLTDARPLEGGSPFPNNAALGMARAEAVARHLAKTTDLSLAAIKLSSVGDAPLSLVTTSGSNNRSVVIQVRERTSAENHL